MDSFIDKGGFRFFKGFYILNINMDVYHMAKLRNIEQGNNYFAYGSFLFVLYNVDLDKKKTNSVCSFINRVNTFLVGFGTIHGLFIL